MKTFRPIDYSGPMSSSGRKAGNTPEKKDYSPSRVGKRGISRETSRSLLFVFAGMMLLLLFLAAHLVVISSKREEEYGKIVLSQQGYSTQATPARRGSITDRNYTVMAYSEEVYNLILDPSVINYTINESNPRPNRNATIEALTTVFGYSRSKVEKAIDENPKSAYVRFDFRLSEADKERFLAYQEDYNSEDEKGNPKHSDKVKGVWFEGEYMRVYPGGMRGATVMGYSNDSAEGHWGLEEYYNEQLTGTPGKSYSYINGDGNKESVTVDPIGGYTLVSTLDYTVQGLIEQKIREFLQTHECTDLGVVVMDPSNGEVLGLATDKTPDPNNPKDISSLYTKLEEATMTDAEVTAARTNLWRNFAVSDSYTPGSVSKELTVAMALEENAVTPEMLFSCNGGETVQNTFIKCNGEHGTIDLRGALMQSCNVAMMNISTRVSASTFLRYQHEMGLGLPTGIDLPGEASGIMFALKDLTPINLATSSFGQGFTCTMMQMAAAYCSLINGGYYFQPRIVSQILDENGGLVEEKRAVLVRQTVTEETSVFLRDAALKTVTEGTAGAAKIDGYTVGGKTGTAQKYPLTDEKYVTSFMAFAPAEDAKVLVYVVINEPVVEDISTISAHDATVLEQEIMTAILPYLGIRKTAEEPVVPTEPVIPDEPETAESPTRGAAG